MKTIEKVVQDYTRGKYTPNDLALEVLQIVNSENLDQIMAAVPEDGIADIKSFIEAYHPSHRIWNAPKPSENAIELLRQWLTHEHDPSGTP